ncbi:uncharacterized protein LOC120985752 isoform X3 [Bufo bufo]|uniref:uncharacterized protein LOC120985752 isoform X3 n=1 Tax=Bufo bufo TaxID=8384 RepID=UPI001ABE400A|nr:uncharacterized protein LOC120985752 isoform X3 [Bufo bufo]
MTAARKVMIMTLLLYSLTSQGKVYSVVLMKDNTRSITCNVPEQENKIVWYKYEEEYFKTESNNKGKTYSVPSEGGIFSCDEKQTTDVSCKSHNIFIILDITGTSFYIIAGSIGGVIAVLAILLLSIFCIKHRGKQKNMQRSSPVDLPDEYECTPYAVSGQKEEINNCVYSLVQNPRPATEAEYSEVQLTKPAISGANGEHKYDF